MIAAQEAYFNARSRAPNLAANNRNGLLNKIEQAVLREEADLSASGKEAA